ncbi:MAG: FAD-binding protein, partial [Acidobacteriia bacterium]|nr:FAD-binding protein [Terriglobia bacterium]
MLTTEEAHARLAAIPALTIIPNEPLSRHTRFAIGGPACLYAETANEESFVAALETARASGMETAVIGGGTNLIVSDDGFPGIVLRYRATRLESDGKCVLAEAGAELQGLVDFTLDRGLKGLETLAGIPGWVGAAVYGNAGAYGHSIS